MVWVTEIIAQSAGIADAAVIASGWLPPLAEIEFHTLAAGDETTLTIHKRVTVCRERSARAISNRSALVYETLHPSAYTHFTTEAAHIERIVDWVAENLEASSGSIAVRAEKFGIRMSGWSARSIEQSIGGALSRAGWQIDLSNPCHTLRIFALNHDDSRTPRPSEGPPLILWGVKSEGCSPWDERTAPKRPYFKPISLDPRVARAMANLACPDGGRLLDPFCGTGGILMEGLGSGLQVSGSDADSRMVWGSRENLEWATKNTSLAIKEITYSTEVRRGSATTLATLWGDVETFDGFAFDPPYGRNSWKSDDGWQLFVDALRSCRTIATNGAAGGARLTTLLPWPPSAGGLDLMRDDFGSRDEDSEAVTFERNWQTVKSEVMDCGWQVAQTVVIPVHRSLARLLLICDSEADG